MNKIIVLGFAAALLAACGDTAMERGVTGAGIGAAGGAAAGALTGGSPLGGAVLGGAAGGAAGALTDCGDIGSCETPLD